MIRSQLVQIHGLAVEARNLVSVLGEDTFPILAGDRPVLVAQIEARGRAEVADLYE